jgi:hypothetical protein
MSKPRVRVTIGPVEAAAPVLLEWPNGLHAWLDRRPRAQTQNTGVRATFGPVFHRLLTSLRGPHSHSCTTRFAVGWPMNGRAAK